MQGSEIEWWGNNRNNMQQSRGKMRMDKKERKQKRIKRIKKIWVYGEHFTKSTTHTTPPSAWWMDLKHDGLALDIDSTSCSRIPRQTRKYSLSIPSLFLFSKKRTYTHSNLFSTFYCQLSYDTTYKYKSARTMGGRDRIIDANPSNKIYGKIIEIKKNKVAPVLLTSYFSENLCTRHNKSTDWGRIRYTIYI